MSFNFLTTLLKGLKPHGDNLLHCKFAAQKMYNL